MVDWIENKGKTRGKTADLGISIVGKQKSILITFTQGTIATKFKHLERISIGVNQERTRMYFLPNNEAGYKLYGNGNHKQTMITASRWAKVYPDLRASSLIGNYKLNADPEENAWYISIGALSR